MRLPATVLSALSAAAAIIAADPDPATLGQCTEFDSTNAMHWTVIEPNGGETYRVGDTLRIRFCTEDPTKYDIGDAEKLVSVDGGKNWTAITYYMEGADAMWVIPETIERFDENWNVVVDSMVSAQCLFRVNTYNQSDDTDKSNAFFSIVPAGSAVRDSYRAYRSPAPAAIRRLQGGRLEIRAATATGAGQVSLFGHDGRLVGGAPLHAGRATVNVNGIARAPLLARITIGAQSFTTTIERR